MAQLLISLGSNLGDRAATLDGALAAVARTPGFQVLRRSSWYATAPVGGPLEQEEFLNGAALIETALAPEACLATILRIEQEFGRRRDVPWGPRTLDLDLLLYDASVVRTADLTLPHPRLSFRKFVLRGACEIAAEMRHPVLGRSLGELHRHLQSTPKYVALVGHAFGFRTQLAGECAEAGRARLVEPTGDDVAAGAAALAAAPHTVASAVQFLAARRTAVAASIAAAPDDWIVDDAWWADEMSELAEPFDADERREFAAAIESRRSDESGPIEPRLLAVLRSGDEPVAAAALAVRERCPLDVALPPVVELDIRGREAALMEFAAALEAAR